MLIFLGFFKERNARCTQDNLALAVIETYSSFNNGEGKGRNETAKLKSVYSAALSLIVGMLRSIFVGTDFISSI